MFRVVRKESLNKYTRICVKLDLIFVNLDRLVIYRAIIECRAKTTFQTSIDVICRALKYITSSLDSWIDLHGFNS